MGRPFKTYLLIDSVELKKRASFKQMIDATGRSRQTISNYLRKGKMPPRTISKIAKHINLGENELNVIIIKQSIYEKLPDSFKKERLKIQSEIYSLRIMAKELLGLASVIESRFIGLIDKIESDDYLK